MSRNRVGFLLGLGLGLLLLAPLLGRGVVLSRDMVFVDGIPLGRQLIGLQGVPRAVPSDLVVALGSRVVGATVFQDVVLMALMVTAGWGATRLAPTRSTLAACAAGTAYAWAPYVHERLLLGQWALLVGWAVLPWAVRAALDWRDGLPGAPTVAWLSVAALGGASALLVVALSVLLCCPRVRVLAATAVLSLPWSLPGLLGDAATGDPRGVHAFAARSDSPLGVVGSLLTGGGVWAPAAVPPGRGAGVGVGVLLLLVAARGVRRVPGPLRAAGAVGFLLAVAGRTPGLDALLRWAVVHVPAAGLLRDGQKWLAPFVLVVALGLACGAEQLRVPARRTALVVAALAPLAALPGAAWAMQGRLVASTVPADWRQVTGQAQGAVLVLPWAHYRAFPWNDDRTVLDPATKLLVRPVGDDALPLTDGEVRGEDPLAARLDLAVRSGEPLRADLQAEDVDQVLVERSARGFDAAATARQTEGLHLVVETDELALYAVPGADGEIGGAVPLRPVLLGDVLALGLAASALVRRRGYLPAS